MLFGKKTKLTPALRDELSRYIKRCFAVETTAFEPVGSISDNEKAVYVAPMPSPK